jgi:predicted dithiol-disulfide oxidoreductase (DUF899 family)
VKLSGLFTAAGHPLVIYHLMYGKKQINPCPMCMMWIDGLNGMAQPIAQNIDFAVVAAAEPKALRDHARVRGWNRLRLLSAVSSTFNFDLGSEDAEGGQDSTVSVFTKDNDSVVRHFCTAHPRMASDIKERGIDLIAQLATTRSWMQTSFSELSFARSRVGETHLGSINSTGKQISNSQSSRPSTAPSFASHNQ